jgi:hypothetical protein
MAKLTTKSASMTSFYDTTIKTTLSKLIMALGGPQYLGNDGLDKTNVDFECETENGDVFTIYDWKEYRSIRMDETIEFHIGGMSRKITEQAKWELINLMK